MMARTGGNPDLAQYQFKKKYKYTQPCDKVLNLRVPQILKDNLPPNWAEKARQSLLADLPEEIRKQIIEEEE